MRFFRKRLLKPLVSLLVFGFMLLLGELYFRHRDGYELFRGHLVKRTPWVREEPFPEEQAKEFLSTTLPELNKSWFSISPELPNSKSPDPQLLERFTKGDRRNWVNYIINESALLRMKDRPRVADVILKPPRPSTVFVAKAAAGSPFPVYRYLPNAVYPTGLRTNRFGFRGADLTVAKPAKTIRIACLGASTTVGGHDLPYSYPELLSAYLKEWAAQKWPDLKIEVINAGREGISPRDSEGILRYELLSFEIDILVYYEGWNHLIPATMVEGIPSDESQRPKGWNADPNALGSSALLNRLRGVFRNHEFLPEVKRPVQHIPGLDEENKAIGDYARFDETIRWKDVLPSLNGIDAACKETGVTMVLCTYASLVHDGLLLDSKTHMGAYHWLNHLLWPISYANLERILAFQNDKFRAWAMEHAVPMVDVAARTPKWPLLFRDGIHATSCGMRVRAWSVFEGLIPLLSAQLGEGRLPRADPRPPETPHPFLLKHSEVSTPAFR
jgi:hypothetical protein